jgi:hypothetical protein
MPTLSSLVLSFGPFLGFADARPAAAAPSTGPVWISADERHIAFGKLLCPADLASWDESKCQRFADATERDITLAAAKFAPIKLRAIGKRGGRVARVRIGFDKESADALEARFAGGNTQFTRVGPKAGLAAAALTPLGNAVVALGDGRAVLLRDPGWLSRGGSPFWRALVSSDRSQVAVEINMFNELGVQTHIGVVCPADAPTRDACQRYWIEAPEGGSDLGAAEQFASIVSEFELVSLRDRNHVAGLRITRECKDVVVRRGKDVIESRQVVGKRPNDYREALTGVGVTRDGDVVAVLDRDWAVLIPITAVR